MTTTPLKLYQVGTFAAGNRLLDPAERTVQSSTGPRELDHLGPPRLSWLRRGARGPGRAGRRDAGDRRPPGHRQRDGLPRGLLHPVPRVGLAGAVAALAVRQRRGRGIGGRRRDAGHRPRRRPGSRPGRRRRHRRHRPGLPVRDVRAQRRRAVRLLRQPGLHEHRRAALRGDAARRQHRHHPAGRRSGRQRVRHRQEPAARSPWPTRSPTSPPPRWPTCTTSRPRSAQAMSTARRALPARAGAVPARAGARPSADTVRVARLATQSGLFPVFEAEHGDGHPVLTPIRRPVPVEEYLRLQTRFAHLFAGAGRPDVVAALQAQADRDIARYGCSDPEETDVMKLPFAITLGPGSSRADHTGTWRTERAVYVRPDRPLRQRLPRRRGRPDLAVRRGERRRGLRGGLAQHHGDQPVPGRHAAGSATTRARPPATAATSTRRSGINSVERFLGDEALGPGLAASRRPPAHRPAGARRRRRARPASPRPTTWPGAVTRSPSASRRRRPAG